MSEMHGNPVPRPPEALPPRRPRRFRSHDDAELSVALAVITPILGGSHFPAGGAIDERHLDTIRVPTIRGHLRFWWRALQPANAKPEELRNRERALWGGMGGGAGGDATKPQASKVNVRVEAIQPVTPEIDRSEPAVGGKGYALFPARKQTKAGQITRETVPRLKPGITFTLRVSCPKEHLDDMRRAVQAWILFGGYGSRTRRGLGSLTVTADAGSWLPASVDALKTFVTGTGSHTDTPSLAGSSLVVGEAMADAEKAWDNAVGQLQYFRQERGFAREQGTQRPGQSRWPEPDKIRHLTGRKGHPPRFGEQPAWPRAQFGLPIVGRFNARDEPGDFQIQWQADGTAKPADRLASPLIVKALPLADGKFVPCALWLSRGFPAGKAVLVMNNRADGRSAAAFETVHGAGDKSLHPALQGKTSVRQAYLDWLVSQCHWKRVSG
jgi:CRISPR-associated protein Cmr1